MNRQRKIRKVDLDQQGHTFSSHVVAGDFIFTAIRGGSGKTLRDQADNSLKNLGKLLETEGATLDDVVKVCVTFKRGQNFEEIKRAFSKYYHNAAMTFSSKLMR